MGQILWKRKSTAANSSFRTVRPLLIEGAKLQNVDNTVLLLDWDGVWDQDKYSLPVVAPSLIFLTFNGHEKKLICC